MMQSRFGWRGAYLGAALLGLAVLTLLISQRPTAADRLAEKRRRTPAPGSAGAAANKDAGWRLLLSPPILLNLGFFVLISIMGGLNTFLVVALGALYGTPDTLANVALTGLLLMNALGVLVGGVLASRTTRHAVVAALALACAGAATLLLGTIGFSSAALIVTASLSGLFVGIASPSRDMLVRAVTPPGAFGRVFGFVSSGFNIGSMVAPMIYGTMMDWGQPRTVFLISAACSILCIGTVIFGMSGREQR
jgi:MFS transporter, FSR family, fosmidomycin resistance protein